MLLAHQNQKKAGSKKRKEKETLKYGYFDVLWFSGLKLSLY